MKGMTMVDGKRIGSELLFTSVLAALALQATALSAPLPAAAQEDSQRDQAQEAAPAFSPYLDQEHPNQVFFGDTHHHSSYSFDSGMFGNTRWEDPDFDSDERAFYYVRVLEIPTPRWTAYDAVRFGVEMPEEVRMTIQDRAYTSPIWYRPGS